MKSKQSGFTLIEIAIVLVIIGLLLGGVMKGQELITSSRVKAAVKDIDGVSAAYQGYIDRYRRLPGDDGPTAALVARGVAWANVVGGDNDGLLEVTNAQTFTGAGEGDNFWQHLRAAGFLNGNPADAGAAAPPRNVFSGLIGITEAGVAGSTAGYKVCLSQVPGKAALALDTQFDDGVPNSGSTWATLGVVGVNTEPGAAAAAYNEDNQYTICRAI